MFLLCFPPSFLNSFFVYSRIDEAIILVYKKINSFILKVVMVVKERFGL